MADRSPLLICLYLYVARFVFDLSASGTFPIGSDTHNLWYGSELNRKYHMFPIRIINGDYENTYPRTD